MALAAREKSRACPLPGVDPGRIMFPYMTNVTASQDFDQYVPWDGRLVYAECRTITAVDATGGATLTIEHNDGTTQTTVGTITVATSAAINDLDEGVLVDVTQRNFKRGDQIRINVSGSAAATGAFAVVCHFEPCTT
jgi:hypothetical protein